MRRWGKVRRDLCLTFETDEKKLRGAITLGNAFERLLFFFLPFETFQSQKSYLITL